MGNKYKYADLKIMWHYGCEEDHIFVGIGITEDEPNDYMISYYFEDYEELLDSLNWCDTNHDFYTIAIDGVYEEV